MAGEDMYGRVANAISTWLSEMPRQVVARWVGEGPAPFAARASQKQLLEFYDRAFFQPDGSPNVEGRQAQLDRLGIRQYAETVRAVLRYREQGALALPALPDEPEQEQDDAESGEW